MNNLVKIVFSFYGLIILVSLILIVIFIVKRVKDKKTETFKKRDN